MVEESIDFEIERCSGLEKISWNGGNVRKYMRREDDSLFLINSDDRRDEMNTSSVKASSNREVDGKMV